jgi:hypothetical protein
MRQIFILLIAIIFTAAAGNAQKVFGDWLQVQGLLIKVNQ